MNVHQPEDWKTHVLTASDKATIQSIVREAWNGIGPDAELAGEMCPEDMFDCVFSTLSVIADQRGRRSSLRNESYLILDLMRNYKFLLRSDVTNLCVETLRKCR